MATPSTTPTDRPGAPRADKDYSTLGDTLRSSAIVVSVSGEADGAAPVRVAAALSARYGSAVSAIQVLDTSQVPSPLPYAFGVARDLIGDKPYEADVRERRRQFTQWLDREVDWPVRVEVGIPSAEILKYADSQNAGLIVLGLRRHWILDRMLRDETTLHVAQRARCAVLAIVPALRELPRQAIVGVDFGPASARAARAALDVLATGASAEDPAVLRLVYVDRNNDTRESTAGENVIARLGVNAAFQQLIEQLQPPVGVRLEPVIRRGAPAEELLTYAEEVGADLIAVGSLRYERLDRWLLGSVTTTVVRDGRCSVLVLPPPPE